MRNNKVDKRDFSIEKWRERKIDNEGDKRDFSLRSPRDYT